MAVTSLEVQRVVLADDHVMFRQGLAALLQREGIDVIGEASDGSEVLRLLSAMESAPDIVVLDLSMPEKNGLEVARELANTTPHIPTVLLTMHAEECYVLEALRVGVSGYVLKAQAASDMVEAIRQVSAGSKYLSPGVSELVIQASKSNTPGTAGPLSYREQQILQLIAEGHTTKDIAQLIGKSAKTVDSHRARIKSKLGIYETAKLVRYAIRQGFIEA